MRRVIKAVLCVFVLNISASVAASEVYHWQDEQGRHHWSDRAPAHLKAQPMEAPIINNSYPAATIKKTPAVRKKSAKTKIKTRLKRAKTKPPQADARTVKERCRQARRKLQRTMLKSMNKKNQRLSDLKTRQRRRATLVEQMKKSCY